MEKLQKDTAFVALLKACANYKDLHKGKSVHSIVMKRGLLAKNPFVGTSLVSMYAKCGAIVQAQEVFDMLPVRNVITWNALISGHCQHGHGKEALDCFDGLKREGLSPSAATFACALKACASLGAAEKGRELHADIVKHGFFKESNLGTALVDMYAKCGSLAKALRMFAELPSRNVIAWTVLISGHSQHGFAEEALQCFQHMEQEGICPDAKTFACVLQACGNIGAAEMGERIHAEISRKGLLQENNVLSTALVDMYAKCGTLKKALNVFSEVRIRDVVSWNALMVACTQHGHDEEAFNFLEKMQKEGLSPDAVTYACILKACGNIRAVEKGKQIHVEIVREGFLRKDSVLGTSLVVMYAKCGILEKAQRVFDELPYQDEVSWTALIAGYSHQGKIEQAIKCFHLMQNKGLFSDALTFVCILRACGSGGACNKGMEVHAQIVREGLLGKLNVLGSALLDMYAKSGALAKAQQVFNNLLVQDVVSWTALITGYAQAGKYDIVFDLYNKMVEEGIVPNSVTFIVVLNVCCHLGLVEEGQTYFEALSTSYGIVPTLEHQSCMVELYGRAGHFDTAVQLIMRMPKMNHIPTWFSLLRACEKWGNAKLGALAFEIALKMDRTSLLPVPS